MSQRILLLWRDKKGSGDHAPRSGSGSQLEGSKCQLVLRFGVSQNRHENVVRLLFGQKGLEIDSEEGTSLTSLSIAKEEWHGKSQ